MRGKDQISKTQLINDDSNNALKNIKNNSIDLIITSPPYYNTKTYSQYESYEVYLNFLYNIFTKCFELLKEGRMCCVNLSPIIIPRQSRQHESKRIPLPYHFVNLMEDIGFKFLEDIIWVKPNGSVPNRNGGFYRHRKPVAYKPNCITEYILIFQKPSKHLIDKILKEYSEEIVNESLVKDNNYEKTNVWYMNPTKNRNHPAPFPLALPYKLIEYYSFRNDLILDPFMGIGTTGVACKKLNRRFIGIDYKKEYYDIAKKRIKEINNE